MKTKTIFAAFLLLLCCMHAGAQSIRYPISIPYIGMGAYSIKHADVFAVSGNKAFLASIESATAGIYGERRFMLPQNSVYALAVALPTSKGNLGIQVNYAGFRLYNETLAGLAYARKLGNKASVGIQFNYYMRQVPSYGRAAAFNVELGALFRLTEKLTGGFNIYNPVAGKLGKSGDEKLPSVYKAGLGFDASASFHFAAECIKEEDKPVNVQAGILYRFKKQFFVRVGFVSETNSLFGAAGISWKKLRIDLATSFHPYLGFSPAIVLITNLKSGK